MLDSRDALISATCFALDHVIENARKELEPLYVGKELGKSYTLQTLLNIRTQLSQINKK